MSPPSKKAGRGRDPGSGTRSVTAARQAQQRSGRWWTGGGIALLVVLIVVLAVVLTRRSTSRPAGPSVIPANPITTATGRDTPPPWPAPTNVTASVHQAGLPMLGSEGTVEHIHAHLDIIVSGRPVTVPQLIGIDEQAAMISPLHTHDATGVIHIESPVQATFSLAQFFTEWQVALSENHLGGLTVSDGDKLHAYVNGKQVDGNTAAITFHPHDEIALVYGPPTQRLPVPSSYAWPPGL